MTYDQWKTTDPREYSHSEEDQPTDLELAEMHLHEVQETAKHNTKVAAARIAELTASLEEALEYFKDRYDVKDGDNGEQLPNEEMRLGTMIDETLYGIRF